MKDPFFIEPIPWLASASQPLADALGLKTLPLHIHEVVLSFLFYSLLYYPISPLLSSRLFPRHYPHLPAKTRISWDTRVVSLVQSLLVSVVAAWVIVVDQERRTMDRNERLWGYTGAAGMVQAMAAGYFLWDLCVTSLHLDIFGVGTLVHAIGALTVYSVGFRPFVNYYGCVFILWELSTPFLNFHWFLDKLGMTGSKAQLYNGFTLLGTFFACRLIWGVYETINVQADVWLGQGPILPSDKKPNDVLAFADAESSVSLWLALAVFLSNIALNILNYNWFFKMVHAVRKRFVKQGKGD